MSYVIDAGPMIALLGGETGDAVVSQVLSQNVGSCYAHAINMAEVYYVYERKGGIAAAENAIGDLLSVGIIIRDDFDIPLWKQAASFKANHAIALPDGFCLALALRIGGTAVTVDHREFDPLVPLGIVPIMFIR